MNAHDQSHPDGRALCDRLHKELLILEPRTVRKPAIRACAFSRGPGANIAHAIHRKTLAVLDVYFPSGPTERFAPDLPVRPQIRNNLGNSWAERFAWHFSLIPTISVPETAKFLLSRAGQPRPHEIPLPEEVPDPEDLVEGAKRLAWINAYERNPKARARCIRRWGATCFVCGFDFERAYGAEFVGFIHVHHVVPLAKIRRSYRLIPENDLRPLCPNCHAAVHHPAAVSLTLEDLRARVRGRSTA